MSGGAWSVHGPDLTRKQAAVLGGGFGVQLRTNSDIPFKNAERPRAFAAGRGGPMKHKHDGRNGHSENGHKKDKRAVALAENPNHASPSAHTLCIGEDCRYAKELRKLHIELAKLQEWIRHEGMRVVVLFEGRDAAGKGGAIKRITEPLNPRICRVVALGTPTEREKTQWYFQRYVAHLPAAGEMVLFDRSWYNRAGVEHVMGFCSDAEYQDFMQSCPEFERMLTRADIKLIKYWFSVSDEEQERRFQERMNNVTKR